MRLYAEIALVLAVVCIGFGSWPTRKRNRRVELPPPDDRCRRSDFKIEPPSRYVP